MYLKNSRNALLLFFAFVTFFMFCFPSVVLSNTVAVNKTELKNLPLPVRYAVSSALGRDRTDYHVLKRHGVISARNAGQPYDVVFSENGITFRKGTARLEMSLAGWGYGKYLDSVDGAEPSVHKNRVEYRRGNLTEWYVNGPLGIQQGFTITHVPQNRQKNEKLQIHLTLTGGLDARIDPDGRGLALVDKNGDPVFRYGGLVAFDADGKDIPAQLAANGKDLVIHVDDCRANYPLTIDPLVQFAKFTASDGASGDSFGTSISLSGDTMVVGSPNDDDVASNSGSAYVFVRPAGGWLGNLTETAKLTASDAAEDDFFGYSVSVSGDTIVVGAYCGDDAGSESGSAYVFVKPAGGWSGNLTESAKLTAIGLNSGDYFGRSVSVSGDTIVVGAYQHNHMVSNSGTAYVFVKPVGGWSGSLTQSAYLIASDWGANNGLGHSVSVCGDTIVAGSNNDSSAGALYVFVKPAGGWAEDITESAKLTASDRATNDSLGASISIDDDTIVAGAPGDADNGPLSGSAYVFVRPEGGWSGNLTESAKLTASDGAIFDGFGKSAAVSGDKVVVGASQDGDSGMYSGSAYVFVRPVGDWSGNLTESAKIIASDASAQEYFGNSVALDGDSIAVGAVKDDENGVGSGSVYMFSTAQTLTTAVAGGGTGTITSSPAGINCPGTCSANLPSGGTVTLTATPSVGSGLAGWSEESCPGNSPICTIAMDADKNVTATFETDSDGDGVDDLSENAGPGGGDGNGDGTQDSSQSGVTSFQDIDDNWVTMVAGGSLSDTMASGNPSPDDLPVGYTPPCGFFGFKNSGVPVGGSTLLILILHNQDTAVNDYWKYGPTPSDGTNHWYQFLDDGTTGATISHSGGKTYITLRLVDGGLGDDDLTANGVIVDVGGPMVSAGGSDGSSSTAGTAGDDGDSGGCFFSATE